MINITTFATAIENGLNAASPQGIQFKIFIDAATYEKAKCTHTAKQRFTNGLIRFGDSTITPTQGIVVATQSAVLEISVPLPNPETDAEIIAKYRALLDGYFKTYTVQNITDADKIYTVSSVYSLAATGSLEQRGGIGTSVTFYVTISYSYIENGINSNNCIFKLDGIIIPYSSAKITKHPIVESNAFSDSDGQGSGIADSFTRSFDFILPAAQNDLTTAILADILGVNMNAAHTLTVQLGQDATEQSYAVAFGENNISFEGIQNAGIQISLYERAFA